MGEDAETVDVGLGADGLPQGLLRTEVVRGAEDLAGQRPGVGVDGTGDAEVHQLSAPLGDHHIGRLDVAVDDSGGVGQGECRRQLAQQGTDLVCSERTVLQQRGEGPTVDELHHEAGKPLVVEEVVDRDDVRVGQLGGEPGLIPEPLGQFQFVLGVRVHDLERDPALEGVVDGLPHLAHAAGRHMPDQPVAVREHQPRTQSLHRTSPPTSAVIGVNQNRVAADAEGRLRVHAVVVARGRDDVTGPLLAEQG